MIPGFRVFDPLEILKYNAMIEPSFRTLSPPAPSRDLYGGNATRLPPNYRHIRHTRPAIEPREIPETMERSGDCMVILPFSRSAFRGTQHNGPSKCECSSFFMSPGDPSYCLCGHPASCHSPKASASESSSKDSSPYIPPISAYTGPSIASPFSVQNLSRSQLSENDQNAAILARLTTLEQLLTSEIHARQVLQENQKYIQMSYQRLSQHCRCLSDEIDLIIAKSGEAARELLDLEVLNQRQRKMAEDIERIKGAIEGLDERTEDLEFRSEDLEKWVDEEKELKRKLPSEVERKERPEQHDEVNTNSSGREEGPLRKRTTLGLNATTTVSIMENSSSTLLSPPLSSKRRRSPLDEPLPERGFTSAPPSPPLSVRSDTSSSGNGTRAVSNKRSRQSI
ncbi:hypothetical protein BDZ91DRAFT_541915 [Kalaharituber pfeilii]|nr:hypothetical protein BDZ91DRAFT_541915 [Kalaharituber pfeilii]